MKNILIIIAALLCFTSCSKEDSFSRKKIKADILCSCNVWQTFDVTSRPPNPEETLEIFLANNNIDFIDLEIVDNGGPESICVMCCGCPSTERYEFKVRKKDLEKMLDFGFTL